LVLTGLDDELLAVQALQKDAQDYLIKGQIETRGLLRAMRYAVARNVMEVKINNDVTELKRLGRRLEHAREVADHANQAKSLFLAGITHELRTPLHGILGYAELLSLEGGLNTTNMERLDAMMAAGQYLLGTINAVLDMSRIESDKLELRPTDIQLPELVRTCLDVVRPAAEAKGLALILAPAPPFRLFADPMRLQQVLINLLGNAVKFTLAGSVEVRLRLTEVGECVRLEVADTGPGIWAGHRDKLFQTFERLNAEGVSGIEGAGLGLAIAARLMQMMGGRIGYADNPGGGSVFWLELPCGPVPLAAVDAAPRSCLPDAPRLRVFVADDELLNRNIASGFLSIAGHEVVCVDNGAAAVEAAATGDFDVILMDVRMPGMNGLEATRLIRALPAPRGQVRVVAVTAQAFAQQIEVCRQAGMDSHVSKPFKQAVLLAALEDVTVAQAASEPDVMPSIAVSADAEAAHPLLDRACSKTSPKDCRRRSWRRSCRSC
jgi:signal transduction histidine kinase/DNA-binding NarL/FixJ family response regulator